MKSLAFSNSLRRVFLSAVAASSLLGASQVFGQVNGPGPSDPMFFNTVINVPEDQAVFNGQTIGDVFNRTTQLNVSSGGTVTNSLRLGSGAEANISGGTLSNVFANEGSELNVTGGSFSLLGGANGQTNISGGTFLDVSPSVGSEVNISGGVFNGEFETLNDSEVNISGGLFFGSFDLRSTSTVNIAGGEFSVNGAAFNDSTVSLGEGDTLTGVLQDGNAFIFSNTAGDSIATPINLTTTALPVPTTDIFEVGFVGGPPNVPTSLREGQTFNVIGGNSFNPLLSVGGTINAENGFLFGRTTAAQSSIDVSGGRVAVLDVLSNSQLNVSDSQTGGIFLSNSNATISNTTTGLITAESSQLDFQNGELSQGLDADNTVVNISGSTEISGRLRAVNNSEVNISGSATLSDSSSIVGSQLNISGGATIGFGLTVSNSTISISGDSTSLSNIQATGSQITIDGGSIGDGSTVRITNSDLTLNDGNLGVGFIVTGGTLDVLGGQIGDGLNLNLAQSSPVGTINVSGGEIGNGLRIATTSIVNVSGGTIGDGFIVSGSTFASRAGGTANISGGVIGNGLTVNASGVANISGGQIGTDFEANNESSVNISGGAFGSRFAADSGSDVDISGGIFEDQFTADSGSTVTISGGAFGDQFTASSGSTVEISGGNFGTGFQATGSSVVLQGGEFRLNGFDIPSLPNLPLGFESVLTGVLADGSSFIFSSNTGDSFSNITLSNVALPTLDLTPLVADASTAGLPSGLRAGQTLTVEDGGVLGNNFEVVDALVNVNAGTVGDGFGTARSTVNVDGGSIGNSFDSHAGSVINVNSGSIGDDFAAHNGSEVNISGGRLGQGFEALSGSVVRINGGIIGRGFDVQSNDVELSGGEFQLNGEAFTGSTISLGAGDVFTGTLQDGSVFVFADEANDRVVDLNLNPTALPSADLTPVFVSSVTRNALGLRAGQTLTLEQDGTIIGEFEAAGGVINVNGGSFADDIGVTNTIVNFNDGLLAGEAVALAGSEFNLLGGTVDSLVAGIGSEINIHGGIIENQLTALNASSIDIFAIEFFINDDEVEFIDFDTPFQIENRNFTLSGTFLDGSEFQYFVGSSFAGDFVVLPDVDFQLNLVTTAVPEPSGLFLLALSSMMLLGKRRRA